MPIATEARIHASESAHYYDREGRPQHTVIAKSTGLPRNTTIKDARKNGWYPSVTTILRVLDKPALTSWKIEQAVLSVLTATRQDGEELDAFVKRVLKDERQQDAQASKARNLGTEIHAAIEAALSGEQSDKALDAYVVPVLEQVTSLGRVVASERVLVGDGYAGTVDCVVESIACLTVIDFKTTSTMPLPERSWEEHELQLAAYAAAWGQSGDVPITTANLYISTTEPGVIKLCQNADWREAYNAFLHAQGIWQWKNDYVP